MSSSLQDIRKLFEGVLNSRRSVSLSPRQFVEQMLTIAIDLPLFSASYNSDASICLKTAGGEEVIRGAPFAKGVFRAVCAGLSKFASQNGGGRFAPYGGEYKFVFKTRGENHAVYLKITNTLSNQHFDLTFN
jgi:hypothetical protein